MSSIPPSWQYPITVKDSCHGKAYLYNAVAEREQRYENQRQMIHNQRKLIDELTELKEDAEDEARRRLDQIRVVKNLMDQRDEDFGVKDRRIDQLKGQLWSAEANEGTARSELERLSEEVRLLTKDRDNWRKMASCNSQHNELRKDLADVLDAFELRARAHEKVARNGIPEPEQVDAWAHKRWTQAHKAVVLRQVVKELRSLLQDRFEVEHVEEAPEFEYFYAPDNIWAKYYRRSKADGLLEFATEQGGYGWTKSSTRQVLNDWSPITFHELPNAVKDLP